MTTMLCAIIVHAALVLTGGDAGPAGTESYAEAHRATLQTGKPLVVMVSTDWCPPCQMMKKTILPRVRQGGLLRRVVFAVVNPDRDGELAEEITGGGPVPQLVMFRKTAHGWMRSKLIGGQSVEAVEQFINEGLASDDGEKGGRKKGHAAQTADHAANRRS
jgi:thioredoxin-like negative regulator of GroEL